MLGFISIFFLFYYHETMGKNTQRKEVMNKYSHSILAASQTVRQRHPDHLAITWFCVCDIKRK